MLVAHLLGYKNLFCIQMNTQVLHAYKDSNPTRHISWKRKSITEAGMSFKQAKEDRNNVGMILLYKKSRVVDSSATASDHLQDGIS